LKVRRRATRTLLLLLCVFFLLSPARDKTVICNSSKSSQRSDP
jgi:hypothetical protein